MSFLIYPKEGDPMSGSGKAGNGRGNNRRRPFRRRDKNSDTWQEGDAFRDGRSPAQGNYVSGRNDASGRSGASERRTREPVSENQNRQNRGGLFRRGGDNARGERVSFVERPKWVPPKINTEPLPVPNCPWCGKPIRDLFQAISDRDTGAPVHFDCVAARIAGGERLEKGEAITYLGGGRFGIVCFGSPSYSRDSPDRGSFPAGHDFRIKKIIEWEDKEKRAEWRSVISDHYSVT